MKPHPRIRKTVKWGGVVVTVLLLVVWIGSGWWDLRWSPPRGGWIASRDGRVEMLWPHPRTVWRSGVVHISGPGVTVLGLEPKGFKWWLFVAKDSIGWWVRVPLWIPVGLSLAVTAAAWRLETIARRRARLNLCPKCNYDRTGLAAGAVCPECGRSTA